MTGVVIGGDRPETTIDHHRDALTETRETMIDLLDSVLHLADSMVSNAYHLHAGM